MSHKLTDENAVRLIEMVIDKYFDLNPLVMEYRELAQHLVDVLHNGRVSFTEDGITYEETIKP